ncbi:T9SS type A sorting domain-containing protein [Bizionia myxarmorum]|uniref:T9SS type A sorting domain-containing protein n=1 Tax=Bizionia myxarmorum TaxID=291186 RepID=A0A5D0RCS0_9FLAO|nr:T9SS type A sorting domain-containing protein [Bizionia myxarmorum]TYB79470.1 T9SS type A sorting domain-containing protein [Bizionia myxarmorum]
MKNSLITAILIFIGLTVKSQTIRYFEFRQPFNTTFTSFIVATSDPMVINDVLNDIALPIADRRFISGNITNGDGGFNNDGTNWYSWHFITNQWLLTSSNVEYCDGISSAIGNHPSVIAGNIFYFCPWNSYPYQEISNPVLSTIDFDTNIQINIYPNPASDIIYFELTSSNYLEIEILNMMGQHIISTKLTKQNNIIDVSNLRNGLYLINLSEGNKKEVKKIIIEH